jgi:iron complex outermembrane receptor protein
VSREFLIISVLVCLHATLAAQSQTATIRVQVRAADRPVVAAEVRVAGATHQTDASGSVTATVTPGAVALVVVKAGYAAATASVQVAAGSVQDVVVDLQPEPTVEETVTVSSTRTGKRLEDQPMRVEVVPGEEVQEKLMMTPGDVSMLLNETNGLRVQTTSPSLGGANVRIQGLRGRYTQILADGLPLYGGQTGSIGLLQIPPMDLGQVEVIKGVASALYGMSAIGGVVNLVSRRPPATGHEAEVLVNQTSHAEPTSSTGSPRRSAAAGATRSSAAVISQNAPTWMTTAGPTCPRTAAWSRGRGSSGRTAGASRSCSPSAARLRNAGVARCPASRCRTACPSKRVSTRSV